MNITCKDMVNHIIRLQGQLESVRRELEKEKPDCESASKTLHSASRSFAGLREEFVESFLKEHFVDTKKLARDTESFTNLLTLIKG